MGEPIYSESAQNAQIEEKNFVESIVNAIAGVPGSDKYDEVGQVIDVLSRDAGKRLYRAYGKFEEGKTASGTLDVAVATGEILWAILLKISFP